MKDKVCPFCGWETNKTNIKLCPLCDALLNDYSRIHHISGKEHLESV